MNMPSSGTLDENLGTSTPVIGQSVDVSRIRENNALSIENEKLAMSVKDLNLYYGEKQALKNINMSIAEHRVTAFIGPSGCGKSTLLRCFNRMNDLHLSI